MPRKGTERVSVRPAPGPAKHGGSEWRLFPGLSFLPEKNALTQGQKRQAGKDVDRGPDQKADREGDDREQGKRAAEPSAG